MASNKVNIRLPSAPNVELHIEGDWVKAERVIAGIDKSIAKGYDRAIEKSSKAILNIVKTAIRSGTPPRGSGVSWPPLSSSYLHAKGKHNIYHLTGLYLKSIGMFKYKSRTIVGLPQRVNRPDTSLTLNQIAIILEHGNDIIPSRPLWAPSFKSYGGKEKLRKEVIKEIRSQIFKDYGINAGKIR